MQNSKAKKNDPIGGIEPPMSFVPFWDISLQEARKIAFRGDRISKGMVTRHQFLALIIDKESDEVETLKRLGFSQKDKKTWEETYVSILLKSDQEEAKILMDQYQTQGFPVSITESKSIDKTRTFSKVRYGALPQVSGENKVDARPITNKMLQLYQSGDRNKQLLIQLRSHLPLLQQSAQATKELYQNITNDYLNQFSTEELRAYEGYQILKKEVRDVRYDIIQKLIDNRKYYNQTFIKLAQAKGTKKSNQFDADWIIGQAVLKSFKTAAYQNNSALFEKAMKVKQHLPLGFRHQSIAESILKYQIKRGKLEAIKEAALQYFSYKNTWYSADISMLEAGANAINKISDQTIEWQQALNWIGRVVKKKPNPTRYRLQLDLLSKLGETDQTQEILAKIETFKTEFEAFKDYYLKVNRPIRLQQKDITKKEYKGIRSIPATYKTFYRYIAREGSLYKKGEAIEPIALLSESATEIEILTRVHLVTGSILPVTHFRSYYIKSTFSLEGEHLGSEYVQQEMI